MPKAPVPAAAAALADAGLALADIDVIKTHNPFAVNDLWFARETGADVDAMNPFGCSLIYGHPQAPDGRSRPDRADVGARTTAAVAEGCSRAAPPATPEPRS